MPTDDYKRIAESWLTVQRHWWAWEALREFCDSNPREALAITPVAVLYCLIPGFQVRGGASHVRVVVSTAIASGIAFPLWQIWCWYVECKLFYTCLGGLRVAAV